MDAVQEEAVFKEMQLMMQKRSVRKLQQHEIQHAFHSNMFVLDQGDRGPRLCIDLRDLNSKIRYHHFKMEGTHTLQQLLKPKDHLTKVDLTKACWHVPMHAPHQKQL